MRADGSVTPFNAGDAVAAVSDMYGLPMLPSWKARLGKDAKLLLENDFPPNVIVVAMLTALQMARPHMVQAFAVEFQNEAAGKAMDWGDYRRRLHEVGRGNNPGRQKIFNALQEALRNDSRRSSDHHQHDRRALEPAHERGDARSLALHPSTRKRRGTTAVVAHMAQRMHYAPKIADFREVMRLSFPKELPATPLPAQTDMPSWVKFQQEARAADDWRHFAEQIPGMAELGRDVPRGLRRSLRTSLTDEKVWVQIGEYGYEGCAYDFAAPTNVNRLCAMHPHQPTRQPLKQVQIGKHTFMLCMDCKTRYLARREEVAVPA